MNLLCCLLAESVTCCSARARTHTLTQRRRRTLESDLMHVLVYSSKNQENFKLLSNINVYLSNANSVTEKNNQERIKKKKDDCCEKLVMLTDVTKGVLTGSKETLLGSDDPWRLLDFIPLHRNRTPVPEAAAAAAVWEQAEAASADLTAPRPASEAELRVSWS